MKNRIHPTALIDPSARLGSGNEIGPFCIIGPQVQMGDNNRLEAYVSIGTPAEHRDYFHQDPGPVLIGSNNIIREYVTINGGTEGTTVLGSDIAILRGSHVGHDAEIRNFANLSCNVLIGGHSIVGQGANLGLAAVIHQNRVIGAYAMLGMSSVVTKHSLPFVISFGSPCEPHRVNHIGLQRSGLSDQDMMSFEKWFTKSQNQVLSKIAHSYQKFLQEYLDDCAKFEKQSQAA